MAAAPEGQLAREENRDTEEDLSWYSEENEKLVASEFDDNGESSEEI